MNRFERHIDNLDMLDKHGLKDIHICDSLVYNGNLKAINLKQFVPITKRQRSLAAAVIGLMNTAHPLSTTDPNYDPKVYIDIQENLLNCKPTCYLILGKPGSDSHNLGESMSKKLNCIHLHPKILLSDELEQKSSTGQCIDFNMKAKRFIDYEILLNILKEKLESPAVKHRGYVISGFPLVMVNTNPNYLINRMYGEEAILIVQELIIDLLGNIKTRKPKRKTTDTDSFGSIKDFEEMGSEEHEEEQEEKLEEEEEIRCELPKFVLNPCSDTIACRFPYCKTRKSVLLDQIDTLFNLQMKPDVIIYLTCPDKDMVKKKARKCMNYKNSIDTSEPFILNIPTDARWPSKYSLSDTKKIYDSHTLNSKYCCRQPLNFEASSINQMCNYRSDVLAYIESKLNEFKPNYVIKLDARQTVHKMLHHVLERLLLLPIKPVIIPEPLYLEEAPEDMEDFWKTVEELNVVISGDNRFIRIPSLWYNRCPVELKNRQCKMGHPKLAVMFMKHVYMLSSLDALVSFCRNPRPYLKINYLEPTCRIIVTGTKSTGKTMISQCLSWIFDTKLISFDKIMRMEEEKKYNTFAKTILSEISATIEDKRLAIWQQAETERLAYLDEWCKKNIALLKSYIVLLIQSYQYFKSPTKHCSQLSVASFVNEEEEETKPEEHYLRSPSPEFIEQYVSLKSQLSFLPIVDDLQFIQTLLLDNQKIVQYAPLKLTTTVKKPIFPVIGDDDVTIAVSEYITSNELQNEIKLTFEEKTAAIGRVLTDIDTETQTVTNFENLYGKYIIDGFPSDSEYWDFLSDSKLMPDYTIAIIENRELDETLIKDYKIIASAQKNHVERFLQAKDPLLEAKIASPKPITTELDIKIIVNDIIKTTFNTIFDVAIDTIEEPTDTFTSSFTESIEKFKENWDNVKLKVEEFKKCFIEVELENKSDVEIVEEVLRKLRQSYLRPCEPNEEEGEDPEDEDVSNKDLLKYNEPRTLCDTNIYCPIAYYHHGVLWKGKSEFRMVYNDISYSFCKEEAFQKYLKDMTRYQKFNRLYKDLPPLRICVIGSLGCGKTTLSKLLSKELGLIHIDFGEAVNNYLIPRHFKKVGRSHENSFTDNPLDDEAVTEFQMDEDNENLISDILSDETELRRMVYNYFERGAPILPQLMDQLVKKIWFDDPFTNRGFILDGFPRLPSDVEDIMLKNYCIPDLIIELEVDSDLARDRLAPKMFKSWKEQLREAKEKVRQKLDSERQDWIDFLAKKIVPQLIRDEIIENMYFKTVDPNVDIPYVESNILDSHPSGSLNVDGNLFRAVNELIQEYPEPVDQTEWEKPADVRERIESRIESVYETDDENIQNLKQILFDQRIRLISIDGTKSVDKVLRKTLIKLSDLRNRCESFFEQTFIISTDIAERLLKEGFCFLSKFQRHCPVYIFENPNAIQCAYKLAKNKNNIFPIIHRCMIYFTSSSKAARMFRKNPLLYIESCNIAQFIEYPLRISVIGPPKSGKSTLASKLAARYGLFCISKGKAVRNIIENFSWTVLGEKIEAILRNGGFIPEDLVIRAVQTAAIDHRSLTYGFVLDGFPETASEAMELCKDGLYPNIIFDIRSKLETLLKSSQLEVYNDVLRQLPPYSRPFIQNRYENWTKNNFKIRNWIANDYQNIYVINGNQSIWQCLADANKIIEDYIPKVHQYLTRVENHVVRADVMCISNEIFEKRMSCYRNLCPLCLHANVLKHSDYPLDKAGLIQYVNKFYWVCPQHIKEVLSKPQSYLLTDNVVIPEIPAIVKHVHMDLLHEDGICIVHYAEKLPSQVIVPGTSKYAASYKYKSYMFCSDKCLSKFMAKPHLYADITRMRNKKILPQLSLDKLPNLGYLEQTLGNIITDACCALNVFRPKYPGLSFQLSGLLHIALYLKTHNPRTDKNVLAKYQRASDIYDARCKMITQIGVFLRSMDNPFASYPVCCKPSLHKLPFRPKIELKKLSRVSSSSGTVRKPSTSKTSRKGFN